MENPTSETTSTALARRLNLWAAVLLAITFLAGFGSGVRKWMQDPPKPEWSYYSNYVVKPLEETNGPEKAMFGYFPGCRAILTIFVRTEPVGYFLFAALNAACCAGVLRMIYLRESRGRDDPAGLLWLGIAAVVPVLFALQNNQLVAPAVYLSMLAFTLAERGKEKTAGLWFALGVLLKSLPLPMLAFPLLIGRWRMVATACLALGLGSLGLATWTDGWQQSLKHHLAYPAQVLAQSPSKAADPSEKAPRSFHHNRSPGAELTRLARATGIKAVALLHPVFVIGTLAFLAWLTVRGGTNAAFFWPKLTAWFAWVAAAAPFGRYYYLLFLLPAMFSAGWLAVEKSGRHRNLCLAGLAIASALTLLTRSPNPSYALLSVSMLAFSLTQLARMVKSEPRSEAALVGG
ncbi:MAG: glycosyltransferase family 87 protein [Verrucomicrobiales bacterium]